jgi:hypothetical protein
MRMRLTEIIDRDYTNVIKRKMEAVYSVQGGQDRAEKERREKEQKGAFVVSDQYLLDPVHMLRYVIIAYCRSI